MKVPSRYLVLDKIQYEHVKAGQPFVRPGNEYRAFMKLEKNSSSVCLETGELFNFHPDYEVQLVQACVSTPKPCTHKWAYQITEQGSLNESVTRACQLCQRTQRALIWNQSER